MDTTAFGTFGQSRIGLQLQFAHAEVFSGVHTGSRCDRSLRVRMLAQVSYMTVVHVDGRTFMIVPESLCVRAYSSN
jgi:hypothetical protein